MKKLLLVLVFIVSSFGFDWAGKVIWAMNYPNAQKIAKQTHKIIFVDLAGSECPPCKYLAQNVYTNKKVANELNNNFISVEYLVDKVAIPMQINNYFQNRSTPTLLFLTPKGVLIYKHIGAMRADDFYKMLKMVESAAKVGK